MRQSREEGLISPRARGASATTNLLYLSSESELSSPVGGETIASPPSADSGASMMHPAASGVASAAAVDISDIVAGMRRDRAESLEREAAAGRGLGQ